MVKVPTDVDLGQALRFVRVVNEVRAKNGRPKSLVRNEVLDKIAWGTILAMQKSRSHPANYMHKDVSDAGVRGTRFRAAQLVQFLAFNVGGGWQNNDSAAHRAIKGWESNVPGFRTTFLGKSFVGCGAARLNNSCVLILAS